MYETTGASSKSQEKAQGRGGLAGGRRGRVKLTAVRADRTCRLPAGEGMGYHGRGTELRRACAASDSRDEGRGLRPTLRANEERSSDVTPTLIKLGISRGRKASNDGGVTEG